MNISWVALAGFVALLLLLSWRWPGLPLFVWPITLLVLPTLRTMVGAAPVYWYDAASLIILARLYFSQDLAAWPERLPSWHWRFVGLALVFGTLVPFVRYGAGPEMLWIFGHASLAWMAFPVGVALSVAPDAARYRRALAFGLLSALLLSAVIAGLQFGNEAMAQTINALFYRDMEGHLVRLEDVGASLSASRVNGPYGDPNTFGGTTAIVCALFLLLSAELPKKLTIVAVALGAVVIGATVSRQVLVAGVLAMMVSFLLGTGRARLRVLGMVVLLLGVVAASGVGERWVQRLGKWDSGITGDENVLGRIVYGPQRMIALIGYDPTVLAVGAGLDVQKLVKKTEDPKDTMSIYNAGAVSNGFLLPLYYMGICGFVLTLAFWLWVLRKALAQSREMRGLHTACVVGAMVLIASDNYAATVEVTVAMLFLLAAIVASRSMPMPHESVAEERLTPLAPRRFPNLVS